VYGLNINLKNKGENMKMKDERPESDELVNYKEEYKFNFKSGVRNVEVAFEGEFF